MFITLEDDTGVLTLEDSRSEEDTEIIVNDCYMKMIELFVPVGLIQNENDRILFEDDDNDTTLTFDEIGTISFDDILRPDRITLADDSDNINKGEEPDEIILENEGELLLDGTDSSQTDAGFKLLQNTPETVVTAQDGGVILLDGTDASGSDAGLRIILEGTTDDLGFFTN